MVDGNFEIIRLRPQVIDFCDYRVFLDSEPGLIRYGVETDELYRQCLLDSRVFVSNLGVEGQQTLFGAPNELLMVAEESIFSGDRIIGTLPPQYYFELDLPSRFVSRAVRVLSDDTTEKIFSGDSLFPQAINAEIDVSLNSDSRKYVGESLNEYMFMTKYDLSATHEKFMHPAGDVETPNGFIITTRPEEIRKHIPEIIKLQSDVFAEQAIQTGYYAGLSDEDTLAIILNPDFIPIIARDKETNEVVMCTLFAPDFTDFSTLPWLNPHDIGKHLLTGPLPDCLTLPLVVMSKSSGLGLLKYAVQIATHETVYRKRPNTVAVMYQSNPLSVFITPRTIHSQILKSGGVCLSKYAEAYYFTEQ